MKRGEIKRSKKAFEREFKSIVKDNNCTNRQWNSAGDTFIKFSLYHDYPTIARNFTVYDDQGS